MSQKIGNLQSKSVENTNTSSVNKTKPIYKLRCHKKIKQSQNNLIKTSCSMKNNLAQKDKKFRYIDEEVIQFFSSQITRYLDQQNLCGDLKKYLTNMMNETPLTTSIIFHQSEELIFKKQQTSQQESQAQHFLQNLQKLSDTISQSKAMLLSDQNLNNYAFQLRDVEKYRKLTFSERQYLIQRDLFEKKFKDILEKFKSLSIRPYTEELIVLTKCYNYNKVKLIESFQKVLEKVQTSQNTQKNGYNFNQEYIKCLIKKTFIKSFGRKNIDFLNFFKLKNHQERNNYEKYLPITTLNQYESYIKKQKNKKIINRPAFPTNCSACFSDHSQNSNPIMSCSECKYRAHKSCMNLAQNCDRCKYKKMGIQLRQKVKECFICQSSGFMLKKVDSQRYAHIFCMLSHNLWKIRDQNIIFAEKPNCIAKQQDSTSLSIDEELQILTDGIIKKEVPSDENIMDIQNQNIQKTQTPCKYCQKNTQYMIKCQSCQSWMHVICGYLNGCHFQQRWTKFNVSLSPICCQQQQPLKLRQAQRKYMLNYNKFVLSFTPPIFSKNDELVLKLIN